MQFNSSSLFSIYRDPIRRRPRTAIEELIARVDAERRAAKFAMALVFAGIGPLIFLCWPAKAQDHLHPVQDAPMHEQFYSKWRIAPDRVTSCCNKQDCYPTTIKFENGNWYALRREDQEWVRIPPERLEQNQIEANIYESPDFNSHVCMPNPAVGDGTTVYCATLGNGN